MLWDALNSGMGLIAGNAVSRPSALPHGFGRGTPSWVWGWDGELPDPGAQRPQGPASFL